MERFNRSVQDQLLVYKANRVSAAYAKYSAEVVAAVEKEGVKWDLKAALRLMLKEYNSRMHSTTKVTPNEAFYQKFITTKAIRE